MMDRQWGPTHSSEYQPIMAGLIIVCTLACLTAFFPELAVALTIFIFIAIGLGVTFVAKDLFTSTRDRLDRLDREAFIQSQNEEKEIR